MPAETTSFVGREADLERLAGMLASGQRFVTILGPAGTGKTRLARRFAATWTAAGRAVWFCELAEARTREALVAAVAASIEAGSLGADSTEPIGHALAGQGEALVVLDNFEQLVRWAPETVGVWLRLAPRAAFVVTSRERLLIEGEASVSLEGLPEPDAVRLFIDRARLVRPDLGAGDAAIASVVRRLEGMPLAIELAAARTAALTPAELHERLERSLDLLKSSQRDASPRRATLRGAIAGSWEPLGSAERAALSACSVFRGGFSLRAAEEVLQPALRGHEGADVLELLESLVSKSLVRRVERDAAIARFALYEAIREFASDKLAETPFATDVRARHAAFFLEHGERWQKELLGRQAPAAAASIRLESDNLLEVVRAAAKQDPEGAVRAALVVDAALSASGPLDAQLALLDQVVEASAGAIEPALLGRLMLARGRARAVRGLNAEARADLQAAGDAAAAASDAGLQADVLEALARHEIERGNADAARATLERALSLRLASREPLGEGTCRRILGTLELKQNRLDASREQLEIALERFREVGCRVLECSIVGNLGIVHQWQGREAEAAACYAQALELAQALGDRREEGVVRTNLALLHADRNEPEAARAQFERALDVQRRAGHRQYVGNVVGALGSLEHAEGRLDRAAPLYEESLAIFRELGNRRYECAALRYLGVLALEEGRLDEALHRLDEAVRVARAVGDLEGFAAAPLGAALALAGRWDEAEEAFSAAAASLERRGEPRAQAILHVLEGVLDARRGAIERAKTRLSSEAAARARRSSDGRVALRILEQSIARAEEASRTAPEAVDLELGDDGRWFSVGGGERVDLSKRRALRLLLLKLVVEHERDRERGVPVGEMVDAGWPGEKIHPEAAASRVYTSIRTLRELGLEAALIRRDDGYLLAPALRVNRSA